MHSSNIITNEIKHYKIVKLAIHLILIYFSNLITIISKVIYIAKLSGSAIIQNKE